MNTHDLHSSSPHNKHLREWKQPLIQNSTVQLYAHPTLTRLLNCDHILLDAWLGTDHRLRGEAVSRKVDALQRRHGRKRQGEHSPLYLSFLGWELSVHDHRAEYRHIVLSDRVSVCEEALLRQVFPDLRFLQTRTATDSGEAAGCRWTDSWSERGRGTGKQGGIHSVR